MNWLALDFGVAIYLAMDNQRAEEQHESTDRDLSYLTERQNEVSTSSKDRASSSLGVATESAKFIAWLGASVGGLTVLLVVVGFLAVSTHDAMLGLPRFLDNKAEYIVVGGLFFGRSIIFAIASLFFPKFVSWIVVVVLLLTITIVKTLPKREPFTSLVFGGLLPALSMFGALYALYCLIKPLQVSNLLLTMSAKPGTPGEQVVRALLENDVRWLESEYGSVVLLVVALSILFIWLNTALMDSGKEKHANLWRWLRVPTVVLLVVCIFLLPRAYGIMTISNEYPEIKDFARSADSVPTTQSSLFLLREDGNVLVLYEPASQSIVTMKREPIQTYKVIEPQPIFSTRESLK